MGNMGKCMAPCLNAPMVPQHESCEVVNPLGDQLGLSVTPAIAMRLDCDPTAPLARNEREKGHFRSFPSFVFVVDKSS